MTYEQRKLNELDVAIRNLQDEILVIKTKLDDCDKHVDNNSKHIDKLWKEVLKID